jgi:hypothetical protein
VDAVLREELAQAVGMGTHGLDLIKR